MECIYIQALNPKQVQTDSGKHGEIGETSSNGFRKAWWNRWNQFKRIQVSMMKLTRSRCIDPIHTRSSTGPIPYIKNCNNSQHPQSVENHSRVNNNDSTHVKFTFTWKYWRWLLHIFIFPGWCTTTFTTSSWTQN